MKEMVGGCCVCSDERGWPENPLVYCDGQNCTVAVHQACYGIVTVPTGPWYCRKCESQERSARVRCELCPSRDGALKKTDNQGWAHVVCALYIPEVRFENVTTMEPIILQLIPPERYSKTCYICQEIGKGNRANVGACMQCNKSGCKQQFHVTCAQGLGLLCEEAGNYLDNVKYCGYCQHHYSKLKKGGNVKTIPPYKPVTHETGSSDSQSSPEKELEPSVTASTSIPSITMKTTANQIPGPSTTTTSSTSSTSSSSKQRKSSSTAKLTSSSSSIWTSNPVGSSVGIGTGANSASLPSSSSSNSKTSSNSSSSSKDKDKHSKSLSKISSSSKNQDKETPSSSSSSSTRDKSKSSKSSKDSGDHSSINTSSSLALSSSNNPMTNTSSTLSNTMSATAKESLGQKFTTSNFTESIVINSESVFGSSETTTTSSSKSSSSSSSTTKKRKADPIKLAGINSDSVDINNSLRDIIKDVSVTLIPLPMDKSESTDAEKTSSKKPKTDSNSSPLQVTHEANLQRNVSPNLINTQGAGGSIIIKQLTPPSSQQTANTTNSTSHIKGPMLKDENRLRSSPSYNSASVGLSGSIVTAPSLYVSVPLSTATVPGVNLPSTTSNASDHVTPSQSSRASPQVSQHHSHHHSSNVIGSSHQSGIERQSPRIHQSQTLSAPPPSLLSDHNTSSCSSQSSTIGGINQSTTSPSVGSSSAVGTTTAASPMEREFLKITYEKQNMRISQLQEQEQAPARRSRTPDSGNFSSTNSSTNSTSLNNGGLKFSYEPQLMNNIQSISPSVDTSQPPIVKESPPSSPGSENGSARKRCRKSTEGKDIKVFHNGVHVHATHMLGNQLNPASSVAQKMSDQLHMELQDHSVYAQSTIDAGPQIVGVPFPGKHSGIRNPTQSSGANSLTSMLGGTGTSSTTGTTPQSLEQLLERQWEQGSQFLMEQAQHFDIASLLSCLHQLQNENGRLEDHVKNLIARRDHLLAVNARLAIPLSANASQGQATLNNMHMNGPTTDGTSGRVSRTNAHFSAQQQMPMENGLDFRHTSHQSTTTSTTISHN